MKNEKRLIDANALLENVQFRSPIDNKNAEVIAGCVDITRRLIENAPTVDAAEVVRCKDCKHLNVLNRKEIYAHCPKTNTVFLPFELDTRTHFCSCGARKAEGQ